MAESLKVEPRKDHGKRSAKRLRAGGHVPAVIYGHGQKTVSLAVPSDQMKSVVRHGARVVQLQGAVSDSALIRELQYDSFGIELLHVDFTRVSAHERVRVKVPLELKGQAQGAKEGGVIEHLIHEVEIECPVSAIPERITVNVTALKIDDSITVGQVTLPEGIKIVSATDVIAVQCFKPKDEEETAAAGDAVEPELIRKEKPADEEEA